MVKSVLYLLIVLQVLFTTSCNLKDGLRKQSKAEENANFIMNNFDKKDIINQFPEKYFPRQATSPVIDSLVKYCDFGSKRGKFVDYYTMRIDGKRETAYIFEYILKCDSLRFIYVYDMENKEPELMSFKVEGIEQYNPMIIDPKKQLLYSKPSTVN